MIYTVDQNEMNDVLAKQKRRLATFYIVTISCGLILINFSIPATSNKPFVIIVTAILGYGAGAIGFFLGMRRSAKLLKSQEVTLDDDQISYERKGIKKQTVDLLKISSIRKTRLGALALYTNGRSPNMYIPKSINGFSEVETKLQEIAIIEDAPKSLFKNIIRYSTYPNLALLGAFFIVKNAWVVSILGVVEIVILCVSAVITLTSKLVDRKTKISLLFVLIVLIPIVYRTYAAIRSL